MAARRKPQVKKIRFELTRSSIAGIGIVLFCIFLWMFLVGVWAGQSLLLPAAKPEKRVAQSHVARTGADVPVRIEAELSKKKIEER